MRKNSLLEQDARGCGISTGDIQGPSEHFPVKSNLGNLFQQGLA